MPGTEIVAPNVLLGLMRIADKTDDEVRELVRTARDAGIDFIDYADIYGNERHGCERRFAEAMRLTPSQRDELTIQTKTGIILGMGETNEEVVKVMHDLRAVDVDILTLGQYLRPSDGHVTLDRYVTPEEFREFRETGLALGFKHVESAPLVRSSYHAWEQVQSAQAALANA